MKKILALLLVLLLPACAMAETWGLSVSVGVDEALLTLYALQELKAGGITVADESQSAVEVVARLLNGLGVDLAVQEDAFSLDLKLGGSSALDAKVYMQESDVFLTSTLLPGYTIQADVPESDEMEQAFSAQLEAIDWTVVSDSIAASVQRWTADIEPDVTRGVYAGDAHEGGTECTTWALSDMDISALVSAFATPEYRNAAALLLGAMELNASDLFARFDAYNDKVADEDKYLYILRIVRNDAGEFVGASLTVLEENAQIATVSFGMTKKEVRLVVGLGLSEQNYWWELTGSQSQLRNITYLSGYSREWVASKEEGFSYVKATNVPVSEYAWRNALTKSGRRYMWDGNISVGADVKYSYLLSFSGTYTPDAGALDCSISLGAAPYEPLSLRIILGPVEAIEPMDPSLQTCSVSDPADAALSEDLLERLAASLLTRLMKVIPAELLMDSVDILPW